MDTTKDTKMQPATDAVIDELRMLAEDLYVSGYNRYSSAMSQAADKLEALRAKIERMEKQAPGFRERCTPSAPTGCSNRFLLYALPGGKRRREMIDITGLREDKRPQSSIIVHALLNRLEAAEKERDALRSLVVMRFDHDHPPQFTQGYDTHELTEPVTAEHCRWFVAEIERLSAEVAHIKEVEFPRKAQAVADGWRGKCERLEAKIEAMEKQEPVGKFIRHPSNGLWEQDGYGDNPDARPLYTLPGAKGE